jgi:hypothetical protein
MDRPRPLPQRCYSKDSSFLPRLQLSCSFLARLRRRQTGAVAYLLDGYQSSFVMSKARVAPLKSDRSQLTLPQLELMAAIIGIRVATAIIVAFIALGISL